MSKLISIEHELSNHLKYTDQDQLQLKHFGKNLTLQAKQLNRDSQQVMEELRAIVHENNVAIAGEGQPAIGV